MGAQGLAQSIEPNRFEEGVRGACCSTTRPVEDLLRLPHVRTSGLSQMAATHTTHTERNTVASLFRLLATLNPKVSAEPTPRCRRRS